jgi:hypothetical protein
MVPKSYDFQGTGPEGTNFTVNSGNLPVTVQKLRFGAWRLTVNVKNIDSTVIATGESTVTLQTGVTQSVSISAKPVAGYGTLDLTVLWTPADVQSPSLKAQVIPSSGAPIDLSFSMPEAGKATSRSDTIPTGYHTLTLQLLDNGVPVMGAVETVRIVNGGITSGSYTFSKVNKPGGSVSINTSPDMTDPLTVSMSGQLNEILVGQSMTVQAAVSGYSGSCVFNWYVNAELKASGQTSKTFTIGSGLPAGVYRLDLVVFTADGSRSGSASHTFSVKEPAQVTLLWDPNTEQDLAGYKLFYGPSSKGYVSSVDVGNQTNYTLTGLARTTTYYIAAKAYNTTGVESDYSNEVVFVSN